MCGTGKVRIHGEQKHSANVTGKFTHNTWWLQGLTFNPLSVKLLIRDPFNVIFTGSKNHVPT